MTTTPTYGGLVDALADYGIGEEPGTPGHVAAMKDAAHFVDDLVSWGIESVTLRNGQQLSLDAARSRADQQMRAQMDSASGWVL